MFDRCKAQLKLFDKQHLHGTTLYSNTLSFSYFVFRQLGVVNFGMGGKVGGAGDVMVKKLRKLLSQTHTNKSILCESLQP